MKPNETDIAYLAGIIDSDGSIFLGYQDKKHTSLRPLLGITNRSTGMVAWIQDTFDCGWNCHVRKKDRCQPVRVLQIGSKGTVVHILRLILPYLKAKKRQAELVLEFCENHKFGKYTERDWEIFDEVKKLNRKGED